MARTGSDNVQELESGRQASPKAAKRDIQAVIAGSSSFLHEAFDFSLVIVCISTISNGRV